MSQLVDFLTKLCAGMLFFCAAMFLSLLFAGQNSVFAQPALWLLAATFVVFCLGVIVRFLQFRQQRRGYEEYWVD